MTITDSRIEPIACGKKQWRKDQATPILKVARQEGQRADGMIVSRFNRGQTHQPVLRVIRIIPRPVLGQVTVAVDHTCGHAHLRFRSKGECITRPTQLELLAGEIDHIILWPCGCKYHLNLNVVGFGKLTLPATDYLIKEAGGPFAL